MRTTKPTLILVALLCLCYCSFSQQIQWADQVIFQHNQYSDDGFSAKQLLGPPDAFPMGKMSQRAFRLNDEAAYGIATVGFGKPIHVNQIVIIENFLPNRISKVLLKDEQGKEHLIYEPKNEVLHISSRVLNINIEKTSYKVAALTIHLNTFNRPGWAQIDAIGISEKIHTQTQLATLINKGSSGELREETIHFAAQKEKMSTNVNSKYAEAKPMISPDGETIYFVRKYCPENMGGKSDQQDIYYSQLINGKWTVAQNMGRPLNDDLPNGICSISPDGSTLYLLNSYNNEEGFVLDGISYSRRTEDGSWSIPEKMEIENYYNNNEYQDFSVSASGNILLMAIEREDSHGDQDIYVSFKNDSGSWSEPKNVGRSVNTELIEYAPFLSIDENVLYFTSTGHTPDSNGDIYYSERLDDTWQNWSKPKNIGFEVNTNGLDAYFSIDPSNKYAYFVSSSEEKGDSSESGLDIFRIPLNIEPEPDNVIVLSGKVYKKEDNSAVFANVQISSVSKPSYNGFAVTNSKTGDYDLKMPAEGTYEIVAEADGFLTYKDTLVLSEVVEGEGIKLHIPMERLSKGAKFALSNLFFIQSKPEMLPESEPELERLYNLLVENPGMEIELSGHTDNEGYRSSNVRLSQDRAEAVRSYLVNRGIDKKRIKTVGLGPDQPIAPNDTEENRAKNRRVEVEILSIK